MVIYIFSFLIILLLFLGLNNSLRKSFLFSMALSLTAIVVFSIEKRINAASLFLLITSYNLVPPVSQEFKKLFKYKRDLMALRLQESKEERQAIIAKEKELEEFTELLSIEVDETAYLYETTKELGVSMRHKEMIQILTSCLALPVLLLILTYHLFSFFFPLILKKIINFCELILKPGVKSARYC